MISGLGILGNHDGKIRSWWMPRWCVYVRMIRNYKVKTYIVVNRMKGIPLILDMPVIVKDNEIIAPNMGKRK